MILGLVSPLFIVVAVVGLIRPSLFKNKKTGAVPKRATLFVGGIAAAMVTVTVGALILPKKDDATKAARDATASPVTGATAQAAQRMSLEITPEELRRKYNRGLSKANANDALPEIEIVHDTVYDGFQQSVGRGIELAGTINKADGSLRELMIQIGNDEPAVMLKAVSALVGIAAAVNPDATPSKDDTETVVNMIQLAMESRKESKAIERNVGKLHYSAVASETGGLLFGISPR